MQTFDVLEPDQSILGHYFLEASAGTGKTFTIEHLFVRLFSEVSDMYINRILVITFTKKATFELTSRIKQNLEQTLVNLKQKNSEKIPEYLKDRQHVKQFYTKIQEAYLDFPNNSIFTIHGFCYHLLNTFFIGKVNGTISESTIEDIVNISRKFLNDTAFFLLFNSDQRKKLLTKYPVNLDWKIVSQIISRPAITTSFLETVKNSLLNAINHLKKLCRHLSCSEIYNIVALDLKKFKNTCNKNKELKEKLKANLIITIENLMKKEDFFDQHDWHESPLIFFCLKNLKKNQTELHTFSQSIIDYNVAELLSDYFNPDLMIAELANHVLKQYSSHQIIREDDILSLALSCLQTYPDITKKIRNFYSAVLVDEFQDTDPTQWTIIENLFMHPEKPISSLFLIGDPKQAIYRFRNADIYTYKHAQNHFPDSHIFSLKTNYRATPELVQAINLLFSKDKNLFYLPKTNNCILYHELNNSDRNQFNYTEKKPCHFLIEKTEQDLFDAVNQEISYLIVQEKIPLNKIAILIKDQNQGRRFSQKCLFPTDTNKTYHLSETSSAQIFKDFLYGCVYPHKIHLLVPILLSPLFQKNIDDISKNLDSYINLFFSYQKTLYSFGILELFYSLMQQRGEHILKLYQGDFLYQEIEYIVEKLQSLTTNPDNYLHLLEKLFFFGNLDDKLKANFSDISENAVQVLTIHAAKGMEFDVVFPLGLIKNHPLKKQEDKEELYAEKIRQTYVSLTRAKKFLYIPIQEEEEPFSPISLFLNKILTREEIKNLSKTHPRLFHYSEHIKKNKIEYQKQRIFLEKPNETLFHVQEEKHLLSFSKIKKETQERNEETFVSSTPHDSGAEFGSLCHLLLEQMNFSEVKHIDHVDQMEQLIFPFLFSEKHKNWLKKIAEIFFNLFNSRFTFPEDSFYFKDIDPVKIFKECEFLFIDESPNIFIKGFIDLLFSHNDIFYIIDWKTNFLGEDLSNYTTDKLRIFSSAMQYDKQIEFYVKAAKKYLLKFSRKQPVVCYGSIIFLRGLDRNGSGLLCY